MKDCQKIMAVLHHNVKLICFLEGHSADSLTAIKITRHEVAGR